MSKSAKVIILLIVLGILGFFGIRHQLHKNLINASTIIDYLELVNLTKEGKIQQIGITNGDIYAYSKYLDSSRKATNSEVKANIFNYIQNITSNTLVVKDKLYRVIDTTNTEELTELMFDNNGKIEVIDPMGYYGLYWGFVYTFFAMCIYYSLFKKSEFNLFSQNSQNKSNKERITFADVAGEDEAKESLQEIVDFLHNPQKYTKIGAKLPKGALMVGPSGTGKTLLAKAVAGEAKVPFLYKSASEFVEMYVGVGAKRVRELFNEAKRCAPCVVFIDEADAIGGARGQYTGGTGGGDSERDQTINQLLTEMDGFSSNKGIVVIAATNRPEMLDQALTRPGRFDRQIIVDKPDLKGREEILKIHCKKVQLDKNVDLYEIALMTTGLVGADLANLINESCIYAIKKGRNKVKQEDIKQCIDLITIGKEKKNRILSDKEKKIVCQHESGHALAGRILYGESQVEKISVVPVQTGALGYVKPKQIEEKYLKTKEEYNKEIIMLLAGRAAEEISFGKENVTDGCANDTEKASNLIKTMISMYGMSEEMGLYNVMKQNGQYLNNGFRMDCSPEMQNQIDELVKNKLKDYYKRALKLIKNNKKILDKLGSYLYEHERLTDKEFDKLYEEYSKKSKKKQKNSRK